MPEPLFYWSSWYGALRSIPTGIDGLAPYSGILSHHPHPLFTIRVLNSRDNLAKLKQLLGHSTIKITEHYLKYTVEDIREEYAEAFRW
jgi:hypothetical protein